MKPALAGAALALFTAGVIFTLPDGSAQALLAILLAAIAGVYIGIGLMVRDRLLVTLETTVALFFTFLALTGLLTSPAILALGYFLHGVWDLAHHPRYLRSPGPWWYKPLCLTYDWLVAILIIIRFQF
ncbi:hypothetical protein KAJ77_11075 [bacterium]|nr:hypothetical protein [bacterium]